MPVHLGDRGTAATDLRPSGFVELAGRRFDARLAHGTVPAGTPVVVTGGDHAGLIVVAAASAPAALPSQGTPLPTSYADVVDAVETRREAAESGRSRRLLRFGTRLSALVGAASAVGCSVALWSHLPGGDGDPYPAAAGLVLLGAAGGVGLYRLLDAWAASVDGGFRRVAVAAAPLAVVGGFGAAAVAVPLLSLPVALGVAAAAAAVLGAVPFGLAVAVGES